MEHKPYITKRILISTSSSAVRIAQKNALLRAGFVIKASKGWVVRETQMEQLKKSVSLNLKKESL
ncbi:MAG: hypothetical protein IPH89_14715 [Bacteroidetes bacterium]|nr:hypothetical protein [Bacteroidota bacterium]